MCEFRDSRRLLRTVAPFDDLVLFMNSLLNGDIMNRSRLCEDVSDKKNLCLAYHSSNLTNIK